MKVYSLSIWDCTRSIHSSYEEAKAAGEAKREPTTESLHFYHCFFYIEEWEVDGSRTDYWEEEFRIPKGKEYAA